GWYKVPKALADKLLNVKQLDGDPESADGFDVCTEAEAKALEEMERRRAERQTVEAASRFNVTDLTGTASQPARPARTARITEPDEQEDDTGTVTTADLRKPPEGQPARPPPKTSAAQKASPGK